MRMLKVVSMLAWRNLWRNHRRTIVMVSAITVGVWAMIFMTALMRGMVNDMIRDGVEALPGLVQVHDPGFRDDPGINKLIAQTDEQLGTSLSGAGIGRWASRLKVPAVVTSERDSRGVTLIAIDPAAERNLTSIADDIVAGRFIDAIDDGGIVVGRKLLDVLETDVGKRVVVMSQDPDNDIADRGFRIVGSFKSSLEATETAMIYAGKQTVQQMLGVPGRVNEVAVMGDDYRHVDGLLNAVRSAVDPNLEVQAWYEIDGYLGSMLSMMDGFVIVWMVVVFLALSFGLVNTLVMAVFERVREIGLMLALGMQPANILVQIIVESLLLLAIGLLLGNLLAVATVLPLRDGIDLSIVAQGMEQFGAGSMLYPELTFFDVALANIVVLGLGAVASLSPAWRASRYEPIEAITKVSL